MTESGTEIAVLTGDLVQSGTLGAAKIARAFEALAACAKTQAAWYGAPLHFSRHRGDGWQVVLRTPETTLRAALMFRATLRALGEEFDSYIGIAQGDVTHDVGPDLNQETAEVFVRSGEALDEIKTTKTSVRMVHDGLGTIDAALILADRLVQGWTPPQAQAIQLALPPDGPVSYSEIAKIMKKSRQAVTKALKAGGIDHIVLALETIDRKAAS